MNRSGWIVEWAVLAGTAAAAIIAAGVWPVQGSAPRPAELPQTAPPANFSSSICGADPVEDTRADPAWVSASFAGDHCRAPVMPVRLDGYSATQEQILAGMAAAKNYALQSDAYQKCISDFVAAHHGPQGRSFQLVENHRILVAEKNKRLADNRIKAAIVAFNEYGSECPE